MNKTIHIVVLTGLIFFLACHYLVMNIHKEYFPVFAYLYPFVGKIWFETGRVLLAFNLHIDLAKLFNIIKYILLLNIVIAIFAFKYHIFYKMTVWIGVILFTCYLFVLIALGLLTIYPTYTIFIACIAIIFLSLLKNTKNKCK